MSLKYVMLMRHGRHEEAVPRGFAGATGDPIKKKTLSPEGRQDVEEVAVTLRSILKEFTDQDGNSMICMRQLLSSPEEEVRATVALMEEFIGLPTVKKCEPVELQPAVFKPMNPTHHHQDLAKSIFRMLRTADNGSAILVVGHQPFMSWLSQELTGSALPMSHAELLCIAFDGEPKRKKGCLKWVLTPGSSTKADLPRILEKIKYKMDTAKLLSVFFTTGLGFILSSLIDKNKIETLGSHVYILYVALFLIALAICLYLATLFAYDSLLMPSRFWGESRERFASKPSWIVARPPSSSLWVLYQNMMHIWGSWFIPATITVLLGMLALTIAVIRLPFVHSVGIAVGALVAGYAIWRAYKRYGPFLGSED